MKIIKIFPKQDVIFKKVKTDFGGDIMQGIRVLRPTQWTVREESVLPISESYEALQSTWEVARYEKITEKQEQE